jgi:hypothetical protein
VNAIAIDGACLSAMERSDYSALAGAAALAAAAAVPLPLGPRASIWAWENTAPSDTSFARSRAFRPLAEGR